VRSEDLQEVIRAAPFRPFMLVLADGRRIAVPRPESIMLPRETCTAVVMDADERIQIVDVALVTAIEMGEQSR